MYSNNSMVQGIEQLRRIIISGPIREETSTIFLEQLTCLEAMDITKPISIYVNTYGGNVDAALCMYDALKACCCPVMTIGIGKVMSAGVLLLAAGDKGSRFITDNTRVMIHEISGEVYGPVSEMMSSIDETRRLQDTYVELLAADTGKTKAKLLKDMSKTLYMNSTSAVKYGIADHLVQTRKVPKNKTTKKKTTKKKTTAKKKVVKKKTTKKKVKVAAKKS